MDYCVLSYIPTLTALLDSRRDYRRVQKREAKALLAAVSHPYQGTRLHLVKEEARIVTQIVPDENLVILSSDSGSSAEQTASADRICQLLPAASIFHLACHGQQVMDDPLESGFSMSDRKLTVAQLMALDLPSAFFAFLSACETAKGDANQPDQAIHLAATMLYAGFKSIVGTMWSVYDQRADRSRADNGLPGHCSQVNERC